MEVVIFRSTTIGNIECEGDLFECYGLQFCFTPFDGLMNAIELSTGFRTDSVPIEIGCYKKLEEKIRNRTKDTYEKALLDARRILEEKGETFPINRRIMNIYPNS